MIELVLNAVKFATSEDVRKSTASLIELIRRSPEWERNICVLEANVEPAFREQAALLRSLCISKMQTMGFPAEGVAAFETAFVELTTNAFEHGCKGKRRCVKIVLEISEAYVALTVLNSKGSRFDLGKLLTRRTLSLKKNRSQLRGRGLVLVSQLADELHAVEKGAGIKAVFYRDRVFLAVTSVEDTAIVRIPAGIHNPSFRRRLLAATSSLSQQDIILNFDCNQAASSVYRAVLELTDIVSEDKRVVAVLNGPEIALPDTVVADSVEDALKKLGKGEIHARLVEHVRALLPES